ncbi:MAG: coenzyme F(420) biosynthesis enzyme, partial [Selenomonadaceae bacterium]|nr:coenzyme F(420) biosynthesis enzyme [Selenomonadaceae bacterium]
GDAAYTIRSAGGPDIKVLDRRKAVSEFKAGIGKHADAYVVMTVANNSGIVCFFDVYRAGTNDLLYTYQVGASRFAKNTPDTFKALSEQFFKKFESSAETQQKKEAREARKKK